MPLKSNKLGSLARFISVAVQHECMALYMTTLPLATIFLLDVLPSRFSLLLLGHLSGNINDFAILFLAYSFTNFFSVFVLSLSCGLDTLNKDELHDIAYYRYATILVCCGFIIYVIAAIGSEPILILCHQPPEIISQASTCIRCLIPYALCYVIFSIMRKSLFQYLSISFILLLMAFRLVMHLAFSIILFVVNHELGFFAFIISDCISMFILLGMVLWALAKKKDMSRLFELFCNFNKPSRQIMKPLKLNVIPISNDYDVRNLSRDMQSPASEDREMTNENVVENVNAEIKHNRKEESPFVVMHKNNTTNTLYNEPTLKKYIQNTWIAGGISCLEWWAVETFTLLVGALRYDGATNLTVFFVYGCWNSLLIVFQMPTLGLSVAMAALSTAYIKKGSYQSTWYTLLQSIGTASGYAVLLSVIVIGFRDDMLNVFIPLEKMTKTNPDFVKEARDASTQIVPFFILSIMAYSVAMCFLGMFVSLDKLARGGLIMLIGYYCIGLVVAGFTGFYLDWKLYGIWLGFACAYMTWCILSLGYWMCIDSFERMAQAKQAYDNLNEETNVGVTPSLGSMSSVPTRGTNKVNYGSMVVPTPKAADIEAETDTTDANMETSQHNLTSNPRNTNGKKKSTPKSGLLGENLGGNDELEDQQLLEKGISSE